MGGACSGHARGPAERRAARSNVGAAGRPDNGRVRAGGGESGLRGDVRATGGCARAGGPLFFPPESGRRVGAARPPARRGRRAEAAAAGPCAAGRGALRARFGG